MLTTISQVKEKLDIALNINISVDIHTGFNA